MSGFIRNALRVSGLKNLLSTTSSLGIGTANQVSRSVWHMSSRLTNRNILGSSVQLLKPTNNCDNTNCRCFQHTKAEKELIEFLAEEIVAEKEAQKLKTIPSQLDGFSVSLDGADVTLVKKKDNEKVTIMFNVNHTVDSETEPEIDPNDDKPEMGEMMSKPSFTVDINRGDQTLAFACSFNTEPGASGADDSYNDTFGIDEVSLFHGEHKANVYAVSGEVMDGYLYDLLMNYLEEKGVSNEFAEKMIELSTAYEHSAYISLLEGLSNFTRASK